MESEFVTHSLLLFSLILIKINNCPLLVLTSIVTPNTDCGTFIVLGSFDLEDFAGLPVDELAVLILEYLEPS